MHTQLKLVSAALAALIAAAAVVACQSDSTSPRSTTYVAQLNGANEVPSLAVGATGTATFTLTGRTISYVVTVNGLSGPAVASHIHFGAAGTNGNIAYPFTAAAVASGQVASGTIDLNQPISNGTTSISGDSLLTLFNRGLVYTNVHTGANQAGEIRGQILRVQSSNTY
ncbi:MAG TPA: CHRD domain-containing protein [Gemmatimonadales bacterium]|nr:CHRD domain-containing protein [Gemmatimonadales bacterium]